MSFQRGEGHDQEDAVNANCRWVRCVPTCETYHTRWPGSSDQHECRAILPALGWIGVLPRQNLHACRLDRRQALSTTCRPRCIHSQAVGRDLGLFKSLNTRRDSRKKTTTITLVFTRQNACEKARLLRYPWPHQRCQRQRDQSCVQKTRFAVASRSSLIRERACGTDIY